MLWKIPPSRARIYFPNSVVATTDRAPVPTSGSSGGFRRDGCQRQTFGLLPCCTEAAELLRVVRGGGISRDGLGTATGLHWDSMHTPPTQGYYLQGSSRSFSTRDSKATSSKLDTFTAENDIRGRACLYRPSITCDDSTTRSSRVAQNSTRAAPYSPNGPMCCFLSPLSYNGWSGCGQHRGERRQR